MTKETDLQMSKDDIKNIDNFNIELLKEATRQAELRGSDEEARKIRIDTRASWLLTLSVGLVGFLISTYITYTTSTASTTINPKILNIAVLPSIIALTFSLKYLFEILQPYAYTASGTTPDKWLKRDLVSSSSEAQEKRLLGKELALSLHSHHRALIKNNECNTNRAKLLNKTLTAIKFSIFFIFLFILVVQPFWMVGMR